MPSLDLRARISASVEPVKQELLAGYAEIEQRITASESELRGLRELRREAERMIHALDPDWEPPQRAHGPKRGTKPKRDQKRNISEEKIHAVEEWLRANMRPDQAFSVASINRERGALGFDVVPPGSLAFAFSALHEDGRIRYDSVGPRGAKLYKLTPAS